MSGQANTIRAAGAMGVTYAVFKVIVFFFDYYDYPGDQRMLYLMFLFISLIGGLLSMGFLVGFVFFAREKKNHLLEYASHIGLTFVILETGLNVVNDLVYLWGSSSYLSYVLHTFIADSIWVFRLPWRLYPLIFAGALTYSVNKKSFHHAFGLTAALCEVLAVLCALVWQSVEGLYAFSVFAILSESMILMHAESYLLDSYAQLKERITHKTHVKT